MRRREGRRVGLRDDGDVGTGRLAGENAGNRILEDQAAGGIDAEATRAEQVTFRARLACRHFLAADDHPGHGNAGGRHAAVVQRLQGQLDGVCAKLPAGEAAQKANCTGLLKGAPGKA